MQNVWERSVRRLLLFVCGLMIGSTIGAYSVSPKDPTLIFEDRFDGDLSNWVVEQKQGGSVTVKDGKLDVDDPLGCTVWYKQPLTAPVLIEYEVTNIEAGGPNDLAGDMNCFWMAKDPKHPNDIFARGAERGGSFYKYADLRLYYVGYGGNNNTTTRFRRYPGNGETPLLPEHDLRDKKWLLTANKPYRIQLIVWQNTVRYVCNGNVVFNFSDPSPMHDGWFGIRTVSNHLQVHYVRIYRLNALPEMPQAKSPEEIITEAGNADSEKERYRLLSELRKRDDLSPDLQQELDVLLPVIDWWANGREKDDPNPVGAAENGYLCGFFNRAVRYKPDWPGSVREESPLYPLRALYRARMLVWVPIQDGGIYRDPERREKYTSEARTLLAVAGKAYPDNSVIAMYNGKAIPWDTPFRPDPKAPAWANYQREGLEKLTELIHWWIDERQKPNGEYGGGWGDDVEMWRWWAPVLMGFDDPKVISAQAKLSRGIFEQPHMTKGYTSYLGDPEHTGEDTADTIIPMLSLDPDNPEWPARAKRIADLASAQWMGENERGFLQFKGTWFSVNEIDPDPKRACDSVYHPRVLLPALLLWQRTGDEKIGKLITRWMDTWIDATRRDENGKPAGVMPSVIHWPDGQVGGGVEPWWQPQNYSPGPYTWPSAINMMLESMLLSHHMTGDRKYLEPISSMAEIWRRHIADSATEKPKPGSEAWCAKTISGFLPGILYKYRFLTGDKQFDDLLKTSSDGYMQMRDGRGRESLTSQLERNARAFRINKAGFTDEVRWTDRVIYFNERWGNLCNDWDCELPRPSVLYSCVTGDVGGPLLFPLSAVRWLTLPREIAALVTDSGTNRFSAELYHFGNKPRKMAAELYLLKPGAYQIALLAEGKPLKPAEKVTVNGARTRVSLELPPRQLVTVIVSANRS